MHYLGVYLDERAGAQAIERYERRLRLSLQGFRLYRKVRFMLAQNAAELRERERREMAKPISLRVAAETLCVPYYVLIRWVRWFGVLSPDENGRVTPQQVADFFQSDWRWLLPAFKLPNS
jgi:DNA-binding transcriptional LysR family regulator